MAFQGCSRSRSKLGDLINTAPSATVLMKECIIGFASKTKIRGKSEGRPWGASHYACSNEKWTRKGYELFRNESGDFSRDYWIGDPLIIESELGFANHAPACWSCANKMMTCLLLLAGRTDGHGIRPRSLKVETISTSMTGVAKGNPNLYQLASQ